MAAVKETVAAVAELEKYQHGFVTDIAQDFAPKGLNADIVRFISAKKDEPAWMLQWRLEAFERWLLNHSVEQASTMLRRLSQSLSQPREAPPVPATSVQRTA